MTSVERLVNGHSLTDESLEWVIYEFGPSLFTFQEALVLII
jgi:hypothetical protein